MPIPGRQAADICTSLDVLIDILWGRVQAQDNWIWSEAAPCGSYEISSPASAARERKQKRGKTKLQVASKCECASGSIYGHGAGSGGGAKDQDAMTRPTSVLPGGDNKFT